MLIRENREALRILEESYIGARYLPSAYRPEDAKASVDLAKKVSRLCKTVSGRRR